MKTRSFTPVGSLHPVLFFAVLYLVALVFFIFICSSIFYSCNARSADISQPERSLAVSVTEQTENPPANP